VQELLKTNQTKLLGVREKLTDLHKHYKELEAQQNRDTTQVSSVVDPDPGSQKLARQIDYSK
jgi:BMFP domain-containing protein YqiC